MKVIYFHIGYPKTGSTFLQKNIFSKVSGINFLNNSYFKDLLRLSKLIFWSEEKEFEINFKSYSSFLKNLDSSKQNIISHEGYTNFSSNPKFTISEIFIRLKKISENLDIKFKFFFVIRKQTEYIKSRYAQGHGLTSFYSVNNAFVKFREVKNFFYKKDRNQNEINTFDSFNYYKTFSDLKKLFNEDPKVLIYEELNMSPNFFLKELFEFINLNNALESNKINLSIQNKGIKSKDGEYFRKRNINNEPLKGSLNYISQFIPFKKFDFNLFTIKFKDKIKLFSYRIDRLANFNDRIILSENDSMQIRQYYKSSNAILSKILKKDLEKLGY